MATASMDTSEVEYLKSCRDKLRDISDILKDKSDEKELSIEEKLKEIKKILIRVYWGGTSIYLDCVVVGRRLSTVLWILFF